ncbi:hypothetical protein SLS62_002247 [Diatrype stigma]|uniref:DJ-1/PfpI domain-containing protein n=1 Tax=Diatrype stigma TaxID=117547 RepID=A0AAN9UYG9_9PEZI
MAPIHVGCPLYNYQPIDVLGPTDLLNSAGADILRFCQIFGPIDDAVINRAPRFVFHHIGATRDPVTLATSNITVMPTVTVDDCPELDILILGGPNPVDFQLHPKLADLVRRHVASGKILFTNCTGAFVAASTGVLDGKNATVNHVEYEWVKKRYPQVKWSKEKKWVVDGNIWTGSGAVAGMDMVAHWLKEHSGLDVLTYGAMGLDYEPRDDDGLFNVLPKRYDSDGKQISTHVFNYHD